MQNASVKSPLHRTQSISRRFSYAFIGVITLILVAFAAVAVFLNIARIDTEIRARLDNAVKMAQISLPTPLWNLDNEVVEDFLGTLFLDDSIVFTQLFWGGQALTEKTRPAFKGKAITYFADSPNFITKKADIKFQGNFVGSIVVVISREAVRKQAIAQISAIVALTVLIIAAISFTSVAITRRYISKPLAALQNSATLIAKGDLDAPIDVGSQDEIGSLARDLDGMRGSLKELVGALHEAKQDLEKKVEERTHDLTETLEQQTATSDVLQVISSSPTDVQPVFDMIARSARRLCEGKFSVVFRFDGELNHIVSHDGLTPDAVAVFRQTYPQPPSQGYAIGRVILTRATVHIPDIAADSEYIGSGSRALAVRSMVVVPMLREGNPIGGIGVMRPKVGAFPENQTELLKTFADQAVIAIENVRLFTETKDALQQQTATAEILRIISSSPTNVQPVFDAIVTSGIALFEGAAVAVVLPEDGEVRLAAIAEADSERKARWRERFPFPLTREYMHGVAIIERRLVDVPDVLESDVAEPGRQNFLASGYRAITITPMLREHAAIGAISVIRPSPGPLSEKQLSLLKTFADQAVIAIENVRLFNETKEALERQTATAEILGVISSSPTDLQPIMDAVAERAARLCGATDAHIWRRDGDALQVVANYGGLPVRRPRMAISRQSVMGRVVVDGKPVHVLDLPAVFESEFPDSRPMLEAGIRTVLGIPLLREGTPIGGILIRRKAVSPFSDKQLELLTTFADQAVIAIENVRLFQELQTRTQQLTRSVEELKALGEVSQVVNSTLNVETVLERIVAHAVHLSQADAGTIYEFDRSEQVFIPRANYGISDELINDLRKSRQREGDRSGMGRVAAARSPVQIPDLLNEPEYALRPVWQAGFRALLAVPLVREDRVVGGLVVRRKTPGEFPAPIVELVQAFATQSTIAIQNARLFQEIQEKSQQLEIASQHKSQFLANMSHELRTPLNAIIGFSEVLIEKMFGDVNEKQEEYLNDILTSGKHLLNLINDILDLSKIEAGKMELEPSTFNLRELLEGSLTVVKERAHAHGIALSLDMADDLDTVIADERKVKQIIFNLLSNAVKFTPDKGKVGIRAQRVADAVEISVWDTGIGIAPEDQQRIFEEFQQAGQTLTNKPEGTGLGLTLTRKFVELHGGTMRLESAPGKGSTFTFTLPLTGQAQVALPLVEPGQTIASPPTRDAAPGPLVLVVEDDPKAIDLLSIYLGEAGYTVETAQDGEEGLKKAKELSPSAIILDVLLPKVDGWDLLTRIKADANTSHIPVIITSIVDQKGRGFALGAADYLVKPFKKKALFKSLDAFGLRTKARAGSIRVLAIDDDPKAVELLAAALEPEGFKVLRSHGGEEGLAIAESQHPDIIILDLLMPGLNGFEVLDRLEKSSTTEKPPVLIFSVKDLTPDEKERLKGRIARFAQKQEYSPQRLVSMVRDVLQRT